MSKMRWDELLARLPVNKALVGAEIGVWQGDLSSKLLEARHALRLYLVDPWRAMLGPKSAPNRYTQANCNAAFARVQKLCRESGGRGIIQRTTSIEAAKLHDLWSLDFVFIDARHNYESVKQDIAAWLPRVKKGGLMSGHDYGSPKYPGVARAVYEQFDPSDVEEGEDLTWFVHLPS